MPIPCREGCAPWQTASVTSHGRPASALHPFALPAPQTPPGRAPLLAAFASRLAALQPDRRIFAAVDGVDGSGKTTFAEALAAVLAAAPHHRAVVRISLDDFHHPRAVRHRRGRESAEGFRHDSYNLRQFRAYVLDPLKPGGSGCYRMAGHDLATDAVLAPSPVPAAAAAVVLVDGMFLHRAELAADWDFSVYLDVPFAVTAARMAVRDGSPPDPDHPAMRRYVGGQLLYFADTDPALRASVVVQNSDPEHPRVIAGAAASYRRQPAGSG